MKKAALVTPLLIICIFYTFCQLASGQKKATATSYAQVTLAVDTKTQGILIPDDFSGLSFETGSERNGNGGVKGHFFDPANKQALLLFKELGIKHLRVGGGSVDIKTVNPTKTDIDRLFEFAEAADLKVLYSFHLLNGDAISNATIAKYIGDRYRSNLECFSIGNEPDWHSYHIVDPEITDYPTYYSKWKRFQKAILDSVPDAFFTGPETGSNYPVAGAKNTNYNNKSWTANFADNEQDAKNIVYVSQHNYAGQEATGKPVKEVIDQMLSAKFDTSYYPALYNNNLEPVLKAGFKYRMTESNSFSGEVDGGSNSYAAALFALDYMHWWAQHNCSGVNFHNKQWVKNAPIYKDAKGNFNVYPIGYGIKAFDIGGHGNVQAIHIKNPNGINLTAYVVKNNSGLYITIINKTHDATARNARINLKRWANYKKAAIMVLTAPNNDVTTTTGITLGGAPISNVEPWQGKWRTISSRSGKWIVEVPAASAMILKIY